MSSIVFDLLVQLRVTQGDLALQLWDRSCGCSQIFVAWCGLGILRRTTKVLVHAKTRKSLAPHAVQHQDHRGFFTPLSRLLQQQQATWNQGNLQHFHSSAITCATKREGWLLDYPNSFRGIITSGMIFKILCIYQYIIIYHICARVKTRYMGFGHPSHNGYTIQ